MTIRLRVEENIQVFFSLSTLERPQTVFYLEELCFAMIPANENNPTPRSQYRARLTKTRAQSSSIEALQAVRKRKSEFVLQIAERTKIQWDELRLH